MKYSKQEIIDTAKNIITDMCPHVFTKEIADNASFAWDLDFDSLDEYEFMMKLEKHFNVNIANEEFDKFRKIKTLDVLCDAIYTYLNPEIETQKNSIKTKEDVFKILNEYLRNKYYIMNAKPSDNFFIDLHFNDIDRSDLCTWAEEKFNIKLKHTYFINLDDFCEKVSYVIQRQKIQQEQLKNKKTMFSNLFSKTK